MVLVSDLESVLVMDANAPIPHTTPVLIFDSDDGMKSMTRTGDNGQMAVFMHCIPGAAVFTLAPGQDRPLESNELNLAWPMLSRYATPKGEYLTCLLYTSPSPRDQRGSRMPSSA